MRSGAAPMPSQRRSAGSSAGCPRPSRPRCVSSRRSVRIAPVPPGPGLLSAGLLGRIVQDVQAGLADSNDQLAPCGQPVDVDRPPEPQPHAGRAASGWPSTSRAGRGSNTFPDRRMRNRKIARIGDPRGTWHHLVSGTSPPTRFATTYPHRDETREWLVGIGVLQTDLGALTAQVSSGLARREWAGPRPDESRTRGSGEPGY
jgi:hypothetical protein